MQKQQWYGNEHLHNEHLSFTRQSLEFEVRRAAREAVQAEEVKRDKQYRLNKSGVFEGEVFKEF